MTQEKKRPLEKAVMYWEIEEEVQPFFDQAREEIFGGLHPRNLSGAQGCVYIAQGYAEYFKTIPTNEVKKRTFVLSRVIHYAKDVNKYWNEELDVFEMCNLVIKE